MTSTIVQTFGKQFVSGLMDMLIIAKYFDNNRMRDLLLQCKMIKRSTKVITVNYAYLYDNEHRLIIRNGNNIILFHISIHKDQIKQILEECN